MGEDRSSSQWSSRIPWLPSVLLWPLYGSFHLLSMIAGGGETRPPYLLRCPYGQSLSLCSSGDFDRAGIAIQHTSDARIGCRNTRNADLVGAASICDVETEVPHLLARKHSDVH